MPFDAYNESDVLISAVQRYFERIDHYPERALVDKIYQKRADLKFCKDHGSVCQARHWEERARMQKQKNEYADNAD